MKFILKVMKIKKTLILGFLSFLFYFFASIYITFPLIFHLGDLVTGLGDEFVIAWTQNYVIHALTTNPLSLFEANLYFPYHNTLAYSDLHLISSILGIIPLALFGQPIAVFNFTVISSLILLGFSIYLLCFYLTKNFWASLLAGTLVIFSPAVLDKVVHVQILAIEWVPLAILFFIKFLDKQKSRYIMVSLLFFLIQTYNSFMPGYFILFSYVFIFVSRFLKKKKQTLRIVTKKNILLVILSFVLLIPIIIPYYKVSKEFNYTRDIHDAVHFAIQPEDLFYTIPLSRLEPFLNGLPFNQHAENGEFKPGYLGFIFTLLTAFIVYRFIRYFKKNSDGMNTFVLIGFLGLVLSLGPVLHLGRQTVHIPFPIPLPYTLFYYLLPGFQGFRNSARFEVLFILLIAIAIALALNTLLKKYSAKKQIFVYFLLIAGCVIEFNFPMKFYPVPQRKNFPQVYSWLNTTPKYASVIIMPAYNWNMPYAAEEIKREYFSTENFRRTVNGYSGFSPPPWQELLMNLHKNFPDGKTLKTLKNLGITYIIIDKEMYDKGFKERNENVSGERVVNLLKINNRVKFIKQIGDYYIFTL